MELRAKAPAQPVALQTSSAPATSAPASAPPPANAVMARAAIWCGVKRFEGSWDASPKHLQQLLAHNGVQASQQQLKEMKTARLSTRRVTKAAELVVLISEHASDDAELAADAIIRIAELGPDGSPASIAFLQGFVSIGGPAAVAKAMSDLRESCSRRTREQILGTELIEMMQQKRAQTTGCQAFSNIAATGLHSLSTDGACAQMLRGEVAAAICSCSLAAVETYPNDSDCVHMAMAALAQLVFLEAGALPHAAAATTVRAMQHAAGNDQIQLLGARVLSGLIKLGGESKQRVAQAGGEAALRRALDEAVEPHKEQLRALVPPTLAELSEDGAHEQARRRARALEVEGAVLRDPDTDEVVWRQGDAAPSADDDRVIDAMARCFERQSGGGGSSSGSGGRKDGRSGGGAAAGPECAACHRSLPRADYSKSQLGKGAERRCKQCVADKRPWGQAAVVTAAAQAASGAAASGSLRSLAADSAVAAGMTGQAAEVVGYPEDVTTVLHDAERRRLPEGSRVRLLGLQKAPELNGCCGHILQFDEVHLTLIERSPAHHPSSLHPLPLSLSLSGRCGSPPRLAALRPILRREGALEQGRGLID